MQVGQFAIFYSYPSTRSQFAFARISAVTDKTVSLGAPSSTYDRKRFRKDDVIAVVDTDVEAARRAGYATKFLADADTRVREMREPTRALRQSAAAIAHEHVRAGRDLDDPFPRNVRIAIGDLVDVCKDLGEVHVVAAGAIYATLALTPIERKVLSVDGINWEFD